MVQPNPELAFQSPCRSVAFSLVSNNENYTKIILAESEQPTQWYNVIPDRPEPRLTRVVAERQPHRGNASGARAAAPCKGAADGGHAVPVPHDGVEPALHSYSVGWQTRCLSAGEPGCCT